MSEAPGTIPNRWKPEVPKGFQSQDVTITEEIAPDSPANFPPRIVSPEKLIAAQRSLLSKIKKNSILSSSLMLPTQPSPESTKKSRYESSSDERDPTETVMNADHEDFLWMDDKVDDDDDSDSMIAELATLRQRQANGNINDREQVRLIKLENKLQLQQRLKNVAGRVLQEDPDEDSLFLPETDHEFVQRHRRSVPGRDQSPDCKANDYESETEATLARMLNEDLENEPTKKSRKPRKKAAKNAREYYANELSSRIERERSKSQKKTRKDGTKKKSMKAKSVKKSKVQKGKKGKKGGVKAVSSRQWVNFENGQDDIGQRILDDLMNNDPICERLQDPIFNLGPEPAIESGVNKATQLQKLLANIPEGSDTRKGRGDKAKLLKASKSFGYANVKGVQGKWLVKGMVSTLYHHQLLGAQWMVERELSNDPPHGGLLADGMGLGKTVQTLACMVGNPPGQGDLKHGVKATLIVVPSSVILQWLDEIRLHVKEKIFPKIMHYKTSANIPLSVLEDLDIVLTSYNEVMRQFPYPDRDAKAEIMRIGYKQWWAKAKTGLGPLHQVDWYRVVLDEAHAIKNNKSKTSLACQNLKSVFRWCLTGTPLLNRLEELFPYLRFLRANYAMDMATFQQHFCDPDADDCHQRITTLLSYSMMRRSMKTTILNRPIITLPPPHPEVRFIDFSAEEKIIYRITENRFRSNLNTFFANGTAQRAYGLFLVQLLRLRQCTSHPFMLERTIRDSWTSEDVAELKRKLKKLSKTTVPFYEQCKQWVTKSVEEREASQALEAMPFGISDFGELFQLDQALDTLDDQTLFERVTCRICADIPMQPVITDCSHIFCNNCLTNHLHQRAAVDDDDLMVCPHCDCFFSSSKPYQAIFVDDDDQIDGASGSQGSSLKRKRSGFNGDVGRGVDALGFEPSTKDSTWVSMSDHKNFPLTPSAKTTALKAMLLQGFHEAPTDKVVIYVQFRTLARIIGRMCKRERWGFLYMTGDSSLEHRTKASRKFRDDPDIKILIAGLKCGGLGLNFPWANRCISLDLWWNHAVEQQAFGRIFRIGQNKETYMTRIVVRHSVDERLFQMQHHKLKTCEKAMNDGGSRPTPNLGLAELASLFGFLETDKDGNIERVDADYDDAEEFEARFGGGESEGRDGNGVGDEMYE
ncbi:hypothetical protein B7494_g1097 [Chlorociboria aeruginascens]|nr:hypothetical protein B7494_g1097 [Chlorociboria aeruginascens]